MEQKILPKFGARYRSSYPLEKISLWGPGYTTNTAMTSEFEILLWPAVATMWLW